MSSTGRVADREESDNYPTPSWCVRRLLEATALPAGIWAEPCVGEGAIVRAVNSVRTDVSWLTQDVRDTRDALASIEGPGTFHHGDLLTTAHPDLDRACVVITNPPFGQALAIIKRARALAPRAIHIFLQRLNFLGSEERHPFWTEWMPDIYQLPNRPSFVRGKTDSVEYGWFMWMPGTRSRVGRIQLLGLTSLAERKRG